MNLTCLFALCVFGIGDAASAQTRLLNSFETPADLATMKTSNARAEEAAAHATEGKRALRIEFQTAEWPNVTFKPDSPWDWRGFGGLALDITNPGTEALEFGIRVDDDPAGNGYLHSRQGQVSIPAGATVTFVLPLGIDPMAYGMRGIPHVPGVNAIPSVGGGTFDYGHVINYQIFMHQPRSPKILILDNVRLIPYTVSMDSIVDQFGQYAKADWPGKVHNLDELRKRGAEEEARLKSAPGLPDRDRFGGWTKGPRLKATGFFRTEKLDGKWWFVDPDGHLFFSLGIDCVNTWADTMVTGREKMFAWMPDKSNPLARHTRQAGMVLYGPTKSGSAYNFYEANLERKFGTDYMAPWTQEAFRRLRAWGFNTIGNWSSETLYRNGQIPYVATTGVGGNHARVSSGSDYWGKMHDPFDPKFREDVIAGLRPIAEKVKGDPWCLGYFVDNELSWGGFGEESGNYGLACGALSASIDSPAKRAFVDQLKLKYGDIATLNRAWGTRLETWASLEQPYKLTGSLNAAQRADMAAFVKSLARQYFSVIRDELKKLDPDHLYMGCRFAWRTPDAVAAAAEICDVVSFNIYAPRVDPKGWAFLADLNKPCIIGEFHFGALDRGMFHPGLVSTPNQEARAAMYSDYVGSVLDNPAFVGCHWFQYLDEPLTGRTLDGENYNIGFVTVTDMPYPEMVTAAKEIHGEAYRRRFGKQSAQR